MVRWYVEGDTEYHAIIEVLPEPERIGLELINLRGNLESGKNNFALTLKDALQSDKTFRRFSMLSFDSDVPANVKAILRQVEQDNIVGFIAAHQPDFEFANFAISELVEIAATIDEEEGISGDAVRQTDWSDIRNGHDFEDLYRRVSARKPQSLKGAVWGGKLAAYAFSNTKRADNGKERPFVGEIRAALAGRVASYDFQKKRYTFQRDNFRLIERFVPPHKQE